MTLAEAVSKRIRNILKERKITQYRLEQNAGISHSTMNSFLNARYKSCNLTTVVLIIRALGMTVSEFFDDQIFENEDLIVE
ncbi:MAG: helix-turn-helix transcriptional regulator [Clostridia bacterium]|nr:helix-turn-helix transcriptional regulator [Clostridia bacterium]